MSTKSLGYADASSTAQEGQGTQLDLCMVELHICGLSGEELMHTKLPAATLGQEVRQMVAEKLPSKPGTRFLLYHGVSKLMLNKTLQEQGIDQEVTLTYTFCSTDLYAAWSFVQGKATEEANRFSLEGVTSIEGASTSEYLCNLPESLRSLTFGRDFNQNLECVTFPNSLQSLTFGFAFNQNLAQLTFPSGLRSLTFGYTFNQILEGAPFPGGLRSLMFDGDFNQRLEGVTFPSALQSLTFGDNFNQSLEG